MNSKIMTTRIASYFRQGGGLKDLSIGTVPLQPELPTILLRVAQ